MYVVLKVNNFLQTLILWISLDIEKYKYVIKGFVSGKEYTVELSLTLYNGNTYTVYVYVWRDSDKIMNK